MIPAQLLARRLAESGHMVITGGGPGIMQAVNEGAGPDHSFGVKIKLPFEANANHVLTDNPRLINYKYFFTRKLMLIKESHAFVCLPGGFGTLDEMFETLTLVQTGKINTFPCVAMGQEYWKPMIEFAIESMLREGTVDPDEVKIEITDSPEQAVAYIQREIRRTNTS